MTPAAHRPKARLGCIGALVLAFVVCLGLYALLAPWSFHIGGRWTPVEWQGLGRLRDSSGAEYGLYLYFFPYFSRARNAGISSSLAPVWVHHPWPRQGVRGRGWVCTADGNTYQFDLRGQIYGAWLDTAGKEMTFGLQEKGNASPRRAFSLYGAWQGPNLVMDDRKSMFIHFLPDGTLTPARSYTSPVPERYAHVTLSWGRRRDFESLCASLPPLRR
ncbi:MAG TPA: hypothetical protein VMI94_16115 [Bryobacteraceae bacterium]|nr:hypothetical protein [Bryobacteraceae bacterium]